MDSSTTFYLKRMEALVGGPEELARITGSRAYERFTGLQIMKMAAERLTTYQGSERISLISSALGSVLLGDYAPIDHSDGSGMNLLDINTKKWEPRLLLAAPGLGKKLGEPVPSRTVYGNIQKYFQQRFGFKPDCALVSWSGDNPCSVAGLGLNAPGDVAISLGTSDTLFGIVKSPTPGLVGHVFVNPVDPNSYMSMLCFKNGSLAREDIRKSFSSSWDDFNASLASVPPGNNGNVLFSLPEPEITPTVPAKLQARYGPADQPLKAFENNAYNVRGIIESQFLSMRVQAEKIGLATPKRIIATGGASSNPAILQVASDVFGVPVYTSDSPDSAAVGAALRAKHGLDRVTTSGLSFETVFAKRKQQPQLSVTPNASAHKVYNELLPRFAELQAAAIKTVL